MIKVIYSNYDKETGLSQVKIKTELGVFYGVSELAEEDRPIASNYAGCRYAEQKAIIKYLKAKKAILASQIKTLQSCENAMKATKGYNDKSVETKAFKKYKYILIKKKQNLENSIKTLHDKMLSDMERRSTLVSEWIKPKTKGAKKK